MQNQTIQYEVFTKPDTPRSDWECFKWLFFEPTLFTSYDETLSRKERGLKFLKIYTFYIIPLSIVIYLLTALLMTTVDFPNIYPNIYKEDFRLEWQNKILFFDKLVFYFLYTYIGLSLGLFIGLFIGLFVGLEGSLVGGLRISLAVNLSLGLVWGLVFGWFPGFILGWIIGWIFGLSLEISENPLFVLGWVTGWVTGWSFGWGFGWGYLIGYFKIIFHFNYLIYLVKKVKITNNPYLHEEVIRLPIWQIKKKLIKDIKIEPFLAKQFINFLLEYRPLQRGLAYELSHVIIASEWKNISKLDSLILNNTFLKIKDENFKEYNPSELWYSSIEAIEKDLKSAESQNNLGFKLDYLKYCLKQINLFELVINNESFIGKDYYFDTIKHWQRLIKEQIQSVEEALAQNEPITRNPYSKGTALTPERENNQLFLERNDLKDEISLKILTSESMPMFLIQGQRRVGKTTLLKFLPEILDSTRFKIITQDLQGFGTSRSIIEWLHDLWIRVVSELKLDTEVPNFQKDDNALEVWEQFKSFLGELHQKTNYKIILAFDEYDAALPKIFQRNVEEAEDLLGRMRSFSQHQNDVVFMFIGSAFFSELRNPSWGNYFVHVSNFRVDYLSRTASLQLINKPTPTFNLKYEADVAERIYDLTQGHPHLLHFICSELVDYANAKYKNPVGHADLDNILRDKVLQNAEQPFILFWNEFCENNETKKVVDAIVHQKPFKENSHFHRLKEHGFIIPSEHGYTMRVPLFAEWIKLFGYWDEE